MHRSVGSFDPIGVHPATSSSRGTYADPEIRAAIKASNDLVNSGQVKLPGVQPGPAAQPPAPKLTDRQSVSKVGCGCRGFWPPFDDKSLKLCGALKPNTPP